MAITSTAYRCATPSEIRSMRIGVCRISLLIRSWTRFGFSSIESSGKTWRLQLGSGAARRENQSKSPRRAKATGPLHTTRNPPPPPQRLSSPPDAARLSIQELRGTRTARLAPDEDGSTAPVILRVCSPPVSAFNLLLDLGARRTGHASARSALLSGKSDISPPPHIQPHADCSSDSH